MISRLVFRNFRNYSEQVLDLNSRLNVFIGENGQGKTNLLEAVFFLSTLRSFRTSKVRDLKKLGSDGFYLGTKINKGDSNPLFLEVEYSGLRRIKVNGENISRSSEFIRHMKVVVFSPEDINIVTGNSGLRRRFLDMLISILEPSYMTALNDYLTALKSRNTVLRSENPNIGTVKAYERILAEKGSIIVSKRKEFLKALKEEVKSILSNFSERENKFTIRYRPQPETESLERYLDKLEQERNRDIDKGFTGSGPQLDEIDFLLNNKLLRNYGSTGQCRLVSLCLKMAQVNLFRKNEASLNRQLIVLVDDVTGELDRQTRKFFFNVIDSATQSFFTFTEKPEDEYFSEAEFFKVNNGIIEN